MSPLLHPTPRARPAGSGGEQTDHLLNGPGVSSDDTARIRFVQRTPHGRLSRTSRRKGCLPGGISSPDSTGPLAVRGFQVISVSTGRVFLQNLKVRLEHRASDVRERRRQALAGRARRKAASSPVEPVSQSGQATRRPSLLPSRLGLGLSHRNRRLHDHLAVGIRDLDAVLLERVPERE